MSLYISFLGGAGTVTGSKFLLETPSGRILIDCGLFQGLKELRLRNRAPFPVDPRSVDAVLLTHAHLDHSGALPLLVKQGFKGPILATKPTLELTEVLLRDFARIEANEAKIANKMGFSKHAPALPLYEEKDVKRALRLMQAREKKIWCTLFPGVKFRFLHAGHILGAATIELRVGKTRLLFSGDLGRAKPLSLAPPAPPPGVDYVIVESTYGDRLHKEEGVRDRLATLIAETSQRSGVVIIPSFAVGRSQDLLYLLTQLKATNSLPDIPIILDSPMAARATEIFFKNSQDHKLSESEMRQMYQLVRVVRTEGESQALRKKLKRGVVIAGSGMITGGRVLSYLDKFLPDARNLVLLAGYQAPGTRGRLLQDGASELKFWGRYVPVGAQVVSLSGLSAHADQKELLAWLGKSPNKPKHCFLVHGEPQAADALRVKIDDSLGWSCSVAQPGSRVQLA